jgi:hypothetical protein
MSSNGTSPGNRSPERQRATQSPERQRATQSPERQRATQSPERQRTTQSPERQRAGSPPTNPHSVQPGADASGSVIRATGRDAFGSVIRATGRGASGSVYNISPQGIQTPPKKIPMAYFITFHTRGDWLHGDSRGSVDRRHNQYGEPVLPADPSRCQRETERRRHAPVVLGPKARGLVKTQIVETCEFRG